MKPTLPLFLAMIGLAAIGCGESVTGPGPGGIELAARCQNGVAQGFPCSAIDLVEHVPLLDLEPGLGNTRRTNDVWGWTDPLDGAEYVLVGRANGVNFVDISDPAEPRMLGRLPSAAMESSWRDIKVYRNHAYVVADASDGHGIQIFDLTRLRGATEFTEFSEDARYTEVSSVHNIGINEETGFAYSVGNNGGGTTCGGGLHMIDLSDPVNPAFAGCYAEMGTGRAGTGYTHDVQCVVYGGPDTEHSGREVCIGSNENALVVADVTDKQNPVMLGTGRYPDFGYVHQGWLSEDHRYFYQNDEGDEAGNLVSATRLLVWDLADLDDPVLAAEHLGPTGAIDHNAYVRGNRLYQSNYTFGIRILDISDREAPVELGYFDTVPQSDAVNVLGSWSNYPYFESGVIAVTSAFEGLFLLLAQN